MPSAPALLHMHRLSVASSAFAGQQPAYHVKVQLATFAMHLLLAWGIITGNSVAGDVSQQQLQNDICVDICS